MQLLNDSNRISAAAAAPIPTGSASMYSATGYIDDAVPSTLHITDASHRVHINLINGNISERFFFLYTVGKCIIVNLICLSLLESLSHVFIWQGENIRKR